MLGSRVLSGFLLSALIASTALASDVSELTCHQVKSREAYVLMLNREHHAAVALLEAQKQQDPNFYLADFYLALAQWVEGYFAQEELARNQGLKAVMKKVKALKKRSAKEGGDELALAYIVAQAHAARIKFAEGQPLSAFNLVRAAKKQAEKRLGQLAQHPDLQLILGLYEYHTSNIPGELQWLAKLVTTKGDTISGLNLIKQAIARSVAFGPEAARALLHETNWRTPELCEYAGLSESLVRLAPKSGQLAILNQGIYLHCGHPELALAALLGFKKQTPELTVEEHEAIIDIHLRALSQLGRVEELTAMQNGNVKTKIALAQAYDMKTVQVAKYRSKALNIYTQLLEYDELDSETRALIRQRIRFPATVKKKIALGRKLELKQPHCDEYKF